MTQEDSLQLIAYRLGQLEGAMTDVKDDTKQVGQILAKLRLDEEVLRGLQIQTDKLEHNQRVTDEKQDKRILHIEDIVLPSHLDWSETARNQKALLMKIAVTVLTAVIGMAGIVGLK